MSFLKKLFGQRESASSEAAPVKSVEHKGFTVRAAPFKSEGRYQTAGIIEKEVAGVRKEHRFIRADSHPSLDQAVEFSLSKGCQIIDHVGERVFAENDGVDAAKPDPAPKA
jgi:hypothetical protein